MEGQERGKGAVDVRSLEDQDQIAGEIGVVVVVVLVVAITMAGRAENAKE